MNIVMHCGGMPFNGTTINEKSLGGSETAAYYVARELSKRGHRVTLFTNHQQEGEWDGVRYRWAGEITEHTPLGDRYHQYAVCTPHDVNISQRHPQSFVFPVAAKVKLWWLHDLALKRTEQHIAAQAFNIDGVLTVSDFHAEQVQQVWGLPAHTVRNIGNAVDGGLYSKKPSGQDILDLKERGFDPGETKALLYCSRPERGLETLVKPGGVMERLAEVDNDFHLYVCGYDNVTQAMANYYNYLWQRCDELPNVTNLGALTKQQLAYVQQQCGLLTYPTVFEETFCITAVEAMYAGLPMLSSDHGALPETCEGAGAVLLPLTEADHPRPGAKEAGDLDKQVNVERFTDTIVSLVGDHLDKLGHLQDRAAKNHTWGAVVDRLEGIIDDIIYIKQSNPFSVAKDMMRNSDIVALERYMFGEDHLKASPLIDEFNRCYCFYLDGTYDEHYRKYYAHEQDKGVDYGPEDTTHNQRFQYVASLVARLPAGATVLDYGCAHGHYTNNLARLFPHLNFVGIDICEDNIRRAQSWAEQDFGEELAIGDESDHSRVRFFQGRVKDGALNVNADYIAADCIIAAEVLEHVPNPQAVVDTLASYLHPGGVFITTTPFGPWEGAGFDKEWPWRAHLHHFDRADLANMFGHHPDYKVTVVTEGQAAWGEPLGSYVCMFGKPTALCGDIDYERKRRLYVPRQTIAACMIVHDSEETILRCLRSWVQYVDEVIIGFDPRCNEETRNIVHQVMGGFPTKRFVPFDLSASPLDQGFDAARNEVLGEAYSDWIFWPDADETLQQPERLSQYAQHNGYDAVALVQHHMSIDPPGVLKTDYPAKLFRNNRGIEFFGVVHEHPETGINQGTGKVLVSDMVIAHSGYTDETTRRGRFRRNIELMARDRATYPDRTLGKFLWLRDLAQMSQQELEQTGYISGAVIERCQEGLRMWDELIGDAPARMLRDALPFYSLCVELLGKGFDFRVAFEGEEVAGRFLDTGHLHQFIRRTVDERVKVHEQKYF